MLHINDDISDLTDGPSGRVVYSYAVNSGESLDKILAKEFPSCREWEDELGDLFAGYSDAKQQQNVLDYDDLLPCWKEMMAPPNSRGKLASGSITFWPRRSTGIGDSRRLFA